MGLEQHYLKEFSVLMEIIYIYIYIVSSYMIATRHMWQ